MSNEIATLDEIVDAVLVDTPEQRANTFREVFTPTDDQYERMEVVTALVNEVMEGRIPVPYDIHLQFPSTSSPMATWYCESLDEMRKVRRALGGRFAKNITDCMVEFNGEWRGEPVKIWSSRSNVCKKVEIGTETVEVEEVVTPAVIRTVIETRPKYAWVCPPGLSGDRVDIDSPELEEAPF